MKRTSNGMIRTAIRRVEKVTNAKFNYRYEYEYDSYHIRATYGDRAISCRYSSVAILSMSQSQLTMELGIMAKELCEMGCELLWEL